MRLVKLWIDGYGRFLDFELELAPGLQVIVGPNEQGKSTIRSFIGDMLYGQKKSLVQRSYEESNELRQPWLRPDPYGGRLRYVLDNGHEYEIHRSFDRRRESVQVFDCRLGEDVTGDFDQSRNREVHFAQAHLGLSKAVFLNAATITHLTIEGLGDKDALSEMREKLLALADAAEERRTAETAIKYLNERIGEIGQPAARTRPLPKARARLVELDRELAEVQALRSGIATLEAEREGLRETGDALEERRAQLEAQRGALEQAALAERLARAESVQSEIDQATQTLFQLSGVRDFPLDAESEVQRLQNAVTTARTQAARTEHERGELEAALAKEREAVGAGTDDGAGKAGAGTAVDTFDEDEQRLTELAQEIARLTERCAQCEREAAEAAERLEAGEADLAARPDFSQLGDDPAETVARMGAAVARCADRVQAETEQLAQLTSERDEVTARLERPARVFEPFDDFPAEAGAYRVASQLHGERSEALEREIAARGAEAERDAARTAVLRSVTLAAGIGGGLLLAACVWLVLSAWAGMTAAAVCGAGSVLSLLAAAGAGAFWAATQAKAQRAASARSAAEAQRAELGEEVARLGRPVDEALAAAGCASLRELEALYERFAHDRETLRRTEFAITAQRNRVAGCRKEAEERFAALRDALAAVGFAPSGEDDADEAIRRAVASWHAYREAGRRVEELRPAPGRLTAQAEALRAEREARRAEERDLALSVRERMRAEGYREESRHVDVLKALRGHRAWRSELRAKRSRLRVLEENLAALRAREKTEREELAEAETRLQQALAKAGVETTEAWYAQAERARAYRVAWDRRKALGEQQEMLLQGQSLEGLREAVDAEPVASAPPGKTLAGLEEELEEVARALQDGVRKDHELEVEIERRVARVRPLREIEEERADVAHRVAQLSLELDAAAHAAAIIEEVAGDRHAQIAPRLQAAAGVYWGRITGGAYEEIAVDRDLNISVRIPETRQLQGQPDKRLSKGAADQLYLAFRLALIGAISETGERPPVLLDDPFAHYDDDRLPRALSLLQEIGQTHQALLFTCHEETAREAETLGALVIRL